MRLITCARCKDNLGQLAAGSIIRKGSVHLCDKCGKVVIAEAFKHLGGAAQQDATSLFESIFGKKAPW